jgi:hypothetical protein
MGIGRDYHFRIDDVSVNTDALKLSGMVKFLRDKMPECRIMVSVSPMVFDMSACENLLMRERVFPAMWHTRSDFREFYKMNKVGLPSFLDVLRKTDVEVASHGMIHVDHRLLKRSAQEMSILTSCALLNTAYFVPPFHKFDRRTEKICVDHRIMIVRYDQSFTHLAYHPFDGRKTSYYFHTHDFTYEDFCSRFPQSIDRR